MGAHSFERDAGRRTVGFAVFAAMCCLVWGLPAAAQAAEAPVIGSTVAYGITQSDATLEAWINPGKLPEGVYYQFQVVTNTSEYLPELACPEHGVQLLKPDGCGGPDSGPSTPGALPIGFIEKEPESRYERVDLAKAGVTLKPGTTYHYRVLAAKRVQSEDTLNWQGPPAVGPDQTFTTLTPGTPPTIEGGTASKITSNDATLEAKIDPEGLATTYEVYLEAPSCQNYEREACEASGGIPIAKGSVPADSAGQTVSVDVAGTGHILTPDTIEGYRVVASNSAGTRYGGEKTFVTLPGHPPVIESVSLSHLTPTDATLEAQINTEGLETIYQFHLESGCLWPQACPEITVYPLPSGKLLGSFLDQSVSLDLNTAGVTLMPGTEYAYRFVAQNGTAKAESSEHRLTTPEDGVQPLNTTPPPGSHSTTAPASNGGQGTVTPTGTGSVNNPAPSPKMTVLMSAQKLSKAVKVCKRKPKKQRVSCVKQAHKSMGQRQTKKGDSKKKQAAGR
jgi:hypothetical protein